MVQPKKDHTPLKTTTDHEISSLDSKVIDILGVFGIEISKINKSIKAPKRIFPQRCIGSTIDYLVDKISWSVCER